MKLHTLIYALLVVTLPVGCGQSQPATILPTPDRSRPRAPDDDSKSNVDDAATNVSTTSQPEENVVQADVRAIFNDLYGGDGETVFQYTHPKVIALAGGEAKTKTALAASLSTLRSKGMALESLTFPDRPTFLKTEVNEFAIVPTKIVITLRSQRAESLNFQLGARANGTKKWKYIEGSRVNNENVKILFPDFPAPHDFPECYRKKL